MRAPGGSEKDCIFCDIITGSKPGYLVYDDGATVAFLDMFPVTRGHLLVCPKWHVPRLTDLKGPEYGGYLQAVSELCRRVERLTTDYNVVLNQGPRAGQIVFHLHFHIIPRYTETNPFTQNARTRLPEAEGRTLVEELSRE